ncbi:MAG: hypothetical protein JWO48_47 [Bryobacterales bacterium]|nr:hypothetical protein [Bryobacterales bacterium]
MVCSWVAMDTVREAAQVANPQFADANLPVHRSVTEDGRARMPVLLRRRLRLISLAAIFLLIVYPTYGQKRREAILRLRDNISTAMAHINLNEKQTQKLDRYRQTLLITAQSGRARKTSSQPNLEATLKEIEKTFHSGPFKPEDRNLVQQDIDQLRAIERNRRTRRYSRKRI